MYAYGFRIYFTPLAGVLFAFPSRYWFAIGQPGVFSLGGWSPRLQSRFHVPRPTRFHGTTISATGLSPPLVRLPSLFAYRSCRLRASPRSLAATGGISVDFFSSGYLDVSVPPVRLTALWIHAVILIKDEWVSPFRNARVTGRLPPHRALSQASTSFIASGCQGIHRMRFIA